jgi:hypothetical protein
MSPYKVKSKRNQVKPMHPKTVINTIGYESSPKKGKSQEKTGKSSLVEEE